MRSWNYLCLILHADVENDEAWSFINDTWPNWEPPLYAAEALTPQLNARADEGWELHLLQPVGVAEDGKVSVAAGTNAYLCVFRREQRLGNSSQE